MRRPDAILLSSLLPALLLAAGCTTSGPDRQPGTAAPTEVGVPAAGAPPAAPTPAVEAPMERVRCFAGPQRITLSTGETQPGAETVVRRTLDPEAGTIVEQTLRIDPLPQVPSRVYTVTYEVDDDRFALAESSGAYSGTGTLRGESWRWTGWSSEYTLTSGIRVESDSEIDGAGSLVTRQKVYGPDGREVMTIEQVAEPLPPDECERRLREASPAGG